MKIKIFMIFALINILIPINASAETIINGNFKNISINDELSNEYITTNINEKPLFSFINLYNLLFGKRIV